MLTKQHIAAFTAASIAWGLFALTVGTSDLDDHHSAPTEVATDSVRPADAMTQPVGSSTLAPAPLGPLAFDDDSDERDDDGTIRTGASVTTTVAAEPSRHRQLVTGLMLESASLSAATSVASATDATNTTAAMNDTDLSLRVGSLPTLAIGQHGDITLVLSNEGPGDATTEMIAYDLPPGVELSAPGPNGCIVEDRQVLCWVAWTLEPGEDTLVTIPIVLVNTEHNTQPIPDSWAGIVVSETADSNSDNDSVSVAPLRAEPGPSVEQSE